MPDEQRRVEPGACTGCGGGVGDAPVFGIQKRQVFEASSPPPPRVIEFVVVARVCPGCGVVNVGRAPGWAAGRVQWGPGVAARGVLATLGHHLPYGRGALVLKQLSGLDVSTGFLVAARKRAAVRLGPFMARVRQLLQAAGLLHVDETPARVDGGLTYLHVACNESYTAMHTGGRTKADIDAGGVLVDFAGCWSVMGTPATPISLPHSMFGAARTRCATSRLSTIPTRTVSPVRRRWPPR
jgi:transposase